MPKKPLKPKLKSKTSKSSERVVRAAPIPSQVEIFEVGPRDGLQSEQKHLSPKERVDLIEKLLQSGLVDVEVGSFIKPGLIPQLDGTQEICTELNRRYPKGERKQRFWAFIPNDRGLANAVESGVDGASFFIAASETFCRKNVNRSQAELLESLPALVKLARKNKLKTRVYVSTLTFCPYEGPIPPAKVARLVDQLLDTGVSEIALSDTTGDTTPRSLSNVLERVLKTHSPRSFALHLHDTKALALPNVLYGLQFGIRRFDSSIAGIGGCPYAPGASGNLSSEDLNNMLLGMGVRTGVALDKLAEAGFLAESIFGRKLRSRILRVLDSKRETQTR